MNRLAVPLSLAALAALGACQAPPQTGGPAQSTPSLVTYVHPYHAGSGVVQAVMPAPVAKGAGSPAEPMQRLEVKMDTGTIVYVDTTSREFTKGSRIVLTENREIRKL